jgi:hypothetical protein
MMDPFDRTERCRARAEELRAFAAKLAEHDASAVTLAVADSLELHARNLEATAVKFHWGHLPSRPALQAAALLLLRRPGSASSSRSMNALWQ